MKTLTATALALTFATGALFAGDKPHLPRPIPAPTIHPAPTPLPGAPKPVPVPTVAPIPNVTPSVPTTSAPVPIPASPSTVTTPAGPIPATQTR